MTADSPPPSFSMQPAAVLRAALPLAAMLALAALAWRLADVLLLGFAAILFAIVLRGLAGIIERRTPAKAPWSLLLAGLLIALVLGGFAWLLGAQIRAEMSILIERLPELLATAGERLGIENLPERVTERLHDVSSRSGFVGTIASYTSGLVGALASLLLVIAAGIYLAARPDHYIRGALSLLPPRRRDAVASAVDNAGSALRLWLLGQLIAMTFVGVITTIGLYAIGMPSALALGFLAGLADFVPVVGPALSAIPAIILALSEGGSMVFWVIGLYLVVQQLEGNLIMPLVQRQTVDLPPVVALFAILILGILFGPLGVMLSAPLTVVLYVAVKQLYLRDTLGEATEIPGEPRPKAD